jgi:SAM-dependent methyltransferase
MMVSASSVGFDASSYLETATVRRIADTVQIELADRAYLPDLKDRKRDWVASVAAPAFRILARRRPPKSLRSFASIGTGSGVDALAAIEILGAEVVGITDLFGEVVRTAEENIRRNIKQGIDVEIHAGAGDLLTPLASSGVKFDVIYENLPNLPIDDAARIEKDRTSAAFLAPRAEPVPEFVSDWLLTLHYLALAQARNGLAPDGVVLSTIGARLPLDVIAEMSRAAGFAPSFLSYGWKVQAEAEDVIGTYAKWQRNGYGPFHFYEADQLEHAFASLDLEDAGRNAVVIERTLTAGRLDALAAWDAFRNDVRIGHTYVVLQSSPA